MTLASFIRVPLRALLLGVLCFTTSACKGGSARPSEECEPEWLLPVDSMAAYPDPGFPFLEPFPGEPLTRPGDAVVPHPADAVVKLDASLFPEATFAVLSPLTGLHVVTLEEAGEFSSNTRFQVNGETFRMIVDGAHAYVVSGDPQNTWTEVTSFLLSDPSETGTSLRLPGGVTDVAARGNVLYVASDETLCRADCDEPYEARLTSIAFDGLDLSEVDEVSWEITGGTNQVSWLFAEDRGFYATSEMSETYQGTLGSIDFSAGDGSMDRGPEQVLSGRVTSRAHLSLFEGTLRVISEDGASHFLLDTFSVGDDGSLDLLANWQLPAEDGVYTDEALFWGDRAYVASAASSPDMISVLDLSDPAGPIVLEELEAPGTVLQFRVFEEHLYAVSYDDEESLTMALSRFPLAGGSPETIRFNGPSYEYSSGDDVRLHVGRHGFLEDVDAVTAFVATGPETLLNFCTPPRQPKLHHFLVEESGFVAAGLVEPLGPSVRPVIFEQGIFAVSESTLQMVQVNSSGMTVTQSERIAERRLLAERGDGDRWVGLAHDDSLWETFLIVRDEQTGDSVEVDLNDMFDFEPSCEESSAPSWLDQIILTKDWAILPRGSSGDSPSTALHFIDLSDPLTPRPLGTLSLGQGVWPVEFTQTESALLIGNLGECQDGIAAASYEVIDLRGETIPTVSHRVEVPALARAALYSPTLHACGSELSFDGDDSFGYDLNVVENLVTGDLVALPFRKEVNSCEEDPRFGVALLDVSDPTEPSVVDEFEAPFLAAQYNHGTGLLAGFDYTTSERKFEDSEECEGELHVVSGDICIDFARQFHVGVRTGAGVEVQGTVDLEGNLVRMSEGRIFWRSTEGVTGYAFDETGLGEELDGGERDIVRFNVMGPHFVAASQTTLFVTDTTDPRAPATVSQPLTRDPCDGFSKSDTHIHCRTGRSGGERIPLP